MLLRPTLHALGLMPPESMVLGLLIIRLKLDSLQQYLEDPCMFSSEREHSEVITMEATLYFFIPYCEVLKL